MGISYSGSPEPRSTTEAFESLRRNLKTDLSTHSNAVRATRSSIDGHLCSMQILIDNLQSRSAEGRKEELECLQLAVDYMCRTKDMLASQSTVLDGTLGHLSQSLQQIICDDVSRHLSSSTSRLTQLEEENKCLNSEVDRLKKNAKDLQDNLRKNEQELRDMNRKYRDSDRDMSAWKQSCDDLKRKYDSLMADYHSQKYTINRLEQAKRELEEKVYRLEMAKRVQRVSVPVQIYCERKDELMLRVTSELMAMLTTQVSNDNIILSCMRCDRREDIQRDKLLLVLCINASRIGTDASNAISGIPQPDRTALLVLHHKSMHALPNQSSDRMLTTSEFKALAGIFDMAFLADKGIYPCDMNNIAINGIITLVKSYMARSN